MYYVYCFRCQPLSKLNEFEIIQLSKTIKQEDKIIIGIINPNPNAISSQDAPTQWRRLLKVFNPLSYWERYNIVRQFIDRANLSDKIVAIVPLLRPSLNMDFNSNYLSEKSERIMCVCKIYENVEYEQKYDGLVSQGENVYVIKTNCQWLEKIFSPELFFGLMGSNDDRWELFIDNEVKEYLNNIKISRRVLKAFEEDETHTPISGIMKAYNNITNINDKNIFFNEFKKYLDSDDQDVVYVVSEREVEDFLELVNILFFDMSNNIGAYEKYAPDQFNCYKSMLAKLQDVRNKSKIEYMTNTEVFNKAKTLYDEFNQKWQTRIKAN